VMGAHHGRAARQRVERRFSLERMVDQYEHVYTELVLRSAAGAAKVGVASSRPHASD
jgi:hypothetical protein